MFTRIVPISLLVAFLAVGCAGSPPTISSTSTPVPGPGAEVAPGSRPSGAGLTDAERRQRDAAERLADELSGGEGDVDDLLEETERKEKRDD